MANETIKISQEQIDGVIVNSVSGPSVNSTDPKHVVIPEIPSVGSVANKAEKDGSNTIGGVWFIDYIMSGVLPANKSVLRVLANGVIEYGSSTLKKHVFAVDNANGLKVKVNNVEGDVWNAFNFNPTNYATINEINNIYDQLSAKVSTRLGNVVSDLSVTEKNAIKTKLGVTDTTYSAGNEIIFSGTTINVSANLIDKADKGAIAYSYGNHANAGYVLVSQVYTQTQALGLFVPINGASTINGTKTFSSSPIVPNATLNNHAVNLGQLSNYSNTRLSNVAGDLSAVEQNAFKNKLNIVNTTYFNGVGLNLNSDVFSVKFGNSAGTVAQGNDTRINNGQTAYSWGNHVNAGYVLISQVYTQAQALGLFVPINGASTINGTKIFSSSPVVPNATLSSHAVNLGQLDSYVSNRANVRLSNLDSDLNNVEKNTIKSRLGNDAEVFTITGNNAVFLRQYKNTLLIQGAGQYSLDISLFENALLHGSEFSVVSNDSSVSVKFDRVTNRGVVVPVGVSMKINRNEVATFTYNAYEDVLIARKSTILQTW